MLRAVIFDMDGLLVDSEPLWRQAEIEVFRAVGVPLTDERCRETVGLRLDAMVRHWHDRYPWTSKPVHAVGEEITTRLVELLSTRAVALPGVLSTIGLLSDLGIPMAVCSSSPLVIIDAVLARLELRRHFRVVHSADADAFGKPHPAPYLTVSSLLEIAPQHCLVFEDSVSGAISAKAARMTVVPVNVLVVEPMRNSECSSTGTGASTLVTP